MKNFTCIKCGWTGKVNGRQRCLPCAASRTKKWKKNNPDKAREHRRLWEKRFRTERPKEYNARRRRKRSKERSSEAYKRRLMWLASGKLTRLDLIEIFELANGKCVYCGVNVMPRFTPSDPRGFDHVVPRSKGGHNIKENMVVSCRNCNSKKSDSITEGRI